MAKLYKPIHFQHTADDFWTIYRSSVCAVERRRAQFFALLAEGRSEEEVLNVTKYAVSTARLMIDRYHTLGLPGLQDGRDHNRGRPRVLTADEQQALAARLHEDFAQGKVWSGLQVQAWVLGRVWQTGTPRPELRVHARRWVFSAEPSSQARERR